MKVDVEVCGPLRGCGLELPEKGLVIITGPPMSGKSLLTRAVATAAMAGAVMRGSVLNRALQLERCFEEEEGELERWLREHVAKTIFASELNAFCSTSPTAVSLTLHDGDRTARAVARMPLTCVEDIEESLKVEPLPGVVGLPVGAPAELPSTYRWTEERSRPFFFYLSRMLEREKPSLDPEVPNLLSQFVEEAWKLSSFQGKIAFLDGEPLPAASVNGRTVRWGELSEGLRALASHLVIAKALKVLMREGKVIVGLVKPELHLDTYIAYKLPELYALLARKYNATFIVATHSETFVKGVEDAVFTGALPAGSVKVYETVGRDDAFTLEEREVKEDGLIEGTRFTTIAWTIIKKRMS